MNETMKTLDQFEKRMRDSMNSFYMTGSGAKQSIRIPKKKVIPDILYQTITNTQVQDKSLKFKGFVAIFDINSKDFPIFDVKILQTMCSNYGFNVRE